MNKKVVKISCLCVSALLLLGSVMMAILIVSTPSVKKINLSPDGYRTSILDQDDHIMRTVAGVEANRVYVNMDQIPEKVANAFVAIEDERFYSHHGIDVKGITRAVVKGITSGSLSQGGSTITQQLLKNNVFTNWMEENSLWEKVNRKVQEMCLAVKVERKYDKETILENYLNTINLGKGSWGVEAASYLYFDKDVSELSVAEASLLAGITKNPSAYNPIDHPEKCRQRQELVLEKMEEQGYITAQKREDVLGRLDRLYAKVQKNYEKNNVTSAYSYFEDALLENVKTDLMTEYGLTSDEAWEKIYRGGLTIHSTQNSDFQDICESVAENDANFPDGQQVSIVMMDTSTGAVQAIIGGRGKKNESLSLNRAIASERQPGSTIKVIGEYAAGLDTGAFTLATTYDDAKMTYSNGQSLKNAGDTYSGKITVCKAIADSKNTVAVKCFQQVGSDTVVEYLERFGLTTLSSDKEGEALALGGTYGGVTNLQMTAAYNSIANGGVYTEPYFYDEVVDHDGNVLLKTTKVQHDTVKSDTAALLTSAMESVLTEGTGTAANFSGMSLAGKSGTTTDKKDLWFVGFSPYYSCGVWGGYDDGSSQKNSSYVKTVWKAVMQKTHSNYKNKEFAGDESLTKVAICTKCGKRATYGVCNYTVQGDMTKEESFAKGTEPGEYCDCHVSVKRCTVSGMKAGTYCPSNCVEEAIYLKEGTEGTDDAQYVQPAQSQSCSQHTSFIDKWFGDDGTDSSNGSDDSWGNDQDDESRDNNQPDDGNAWGGGNSQGSEQTQEDNENGGEWYDPSTWGNYFRW